MKYYYLVTILFSLICYQILAAVQFREDVEDNEFAEFEEFDEEEVKSAKPYVKEAPQARKIEQTIEEGNDFNEDDVVVEVKFLFINCSFFPCNKKGPKPRKIIIGVEVSYCVFKLISQNSLSLL